jgi:hypothetical protein
MQRVVRQPYPSPSKGEGPGMGVNALRYEERRGRRCLRAVYSTSCARPPHSRPLPLDGGEEVRG